MAILCHKSHLSFLLCFIVLQLKYRPNSVQIDSGNRGREKKKLARAGEGVEEVGVPLPLLRDRER